RSFGVLARRSELGRILLGRRRGPRELGDLVCAPRRRPSCRSRAQPDANAARALSRRRTGEWHVHEAAVERRPTVGRQRLWRVRVHRDAAVVFPRLSAIGLADVAAVRRGGDRAQGIGEGERVETEVRESAVERLADAIGIVPKYLDQTGTEW